MIENWVRQRSGMEGLFRTLSISALELMNRSFRLLTAFLTLGVSILLTATTPVYAEPTAIIYIEPGASPVIINAANVLSGKLKDISSYDFTINDKETWSGKGIYLGSSKGIAAGLVPTKVTQLGNEGVYIKGTSMGVLITGNTDRAIAEASTLYLEKLGVRIYFPHPSWHIVPKTKVIYSDWTLLTKPSLEARRYFYAYGTDSKVADEDFSNWNYFNRMGGSLGINVGHSWTGIYLRNKAVFDAHPEYLMQLQNGTRQVVGNPEGVKFCSSNEGLVQLCIDDVMKQFEKSMVNGDPATGLQMVSMDPSDGPAVCLCAECQKLGTPSDQIFYLANRVAKAVREKYPNKSIGLYAYSSHALPTKIELEPNIFVMIATAFNSTPYTYDQLVSLWGQKVPRLGCRDYFGVMAWDYDMPGKPLGAKIALVKKRLQASVQQKMVGFLAETNIGWMSRGLGHYIGAQLLWNSQVDVDGLVNEFYDNCFGKARPPIEELFKMWQDGVHVTGNDLAIWLNKLKEADALADRSDIHERIDQLKLYLHYVGLYLDWKGNTNPSNLEPYTNLLSFTYRIKNLGVCASYPLERRIANATAPSFEYSFKNPNAVWKQNKTPVEKAEIDQLFADDLKRFHEIEGLNNEIFSSTLEPFTSQAGANVPTVNSRFRRECFILVPGSGTRFINVKMGFIQSGGSVPGSVKIYKADQQIDDDNDQPVLEKSIPVDNVVQTIDLSGLDSGLYRVVMLENKRGVSFSASPDIKYSFPADLDQSMYTFGRAQYVFYVPRRTARFVIYRGGPLTLKSPAGRIIDLQESVNGLVPIDVLKDEIGIWTLSKQSGAFYFTGIPGHVAPTVNQLLVPEGLRPYEPYTKEPSAILDSSYLRFNHELILKVPETGSTSLAISMGHITTSSTIPGSVKVYSETFAADLSSAQPVLTQSIPLNRIPVNISFAGLKPGDYRIVIKDSNSGFVIVPSVNLKYSFRAEFKQPIFTLTRGNYCFFVSKFYSQFSIYHAGPLTLVSPIGRVVNLQNTLPGITEIKMLDNEFGLWKILQQNGRLYLNGIPGLVSANPDSLLLPAGLN